MGVVYFLLVVAGLVLTYYGFASAGQRSGAASLGGALVMLAGIALLFAGLLMGLVPGFFG
jgi:hypothetical protein